ncbi:MAG TPA: hypothetical protein VKR38_13335 [Usitatibacter sp.]|nr:hypothetical protein [Usitatibacter sp.]
MSWRIRFAAFVVAVSSLCGASAMAQVLYAATGSNGRPGTLFTIDTATGRILSSAPIMLGATQICITGLAANPFTNLLYGIVSNNCATNNGALVTIDPTNGAATFIGNTGGGSDLAFSPGGILYMWQQSTTALATVDLTTGVATTIGASGLPGTTGGGVAVIGSTVYVAPNGASGPLATINTTTGAGTVVATLNGAPFTAAINAMAFGGGALYGVDSDTGGPANTRLVRIDPAGGAVTLVGTLPLDIDALAFGPAAGVPTLGNGMMIAMFAAMFALGLLAIRRNSLRA